MSINLPEIYFMRDFSAMRRSVLCLLSTVPVAMIAVTSCASAPKMSANATPADARNGHLVIVGGALDEKNAAVYKRFVELAGPGAKIGVLPTASGVEDAGFSLADEINGYSAPGTAEVIEVREKTSAAANTEP
ncbi:MAG: hypothetical protein ABI579_02255, partial [Candidatus Sumerlaeota bacterium]